MAHPEQERFPARICRLALAAGFAAVMLVVGAAQAQTFTVLHAFSGGADGGAPLGGVALDQGGNLYGTTWLGGTGGQGAAYELKRSPSGYTLNTLYSFSTGSNGGYPKSNVVFARGGALYGTTTEGGYLGCGAHGYVGCGVVFSLRPQSTFCRSVLCPWNEAPLYAFQGITSGDGDNPLYGAPAFDQAGNIYGTTPNDGSYGGGTVFELTRSGDTWTESILHQFGAAGDGSRPEHGVVLDSFGNLYGTTYSGGTFGAGTVFQLVPSGSGWTENVLANFRGDDDIGGSPQAGLIIDQGGNLYGATSIASAFDGVVFELSPSGGGWQFTVLHRFTVGNQSGVVGNLVFDSQGNLYGATWGDGVGLNGMLFKLTPTGDGWNLTDLHDFLYRDDGGQPSGDLAIDASGNIYGTTENGGHGNFGTVWKYTP